MGLKANAIKRHTLRFEALRQRVHRVALWSDALDIVVVQEQPGVRISLVRPSQRVGNIVRAERVQPHRRPQGTILIERLLDAIPLPDFAAEMPGLSGDMLLEDVSKLRVGKGSRDQPGRQLVVPDQIMAAHYLVVLLGKLYLGVCLFKGRDTALNLD